MELVKAKRKAVPMLISLSGTSGSGKTFSGLLLAAGLAGPNGRVGMIDTENGRGSMYADDPLITAALPNSYEIVEIQAPFEPAKYTEAIKFMEKAGITVCLIDSTSHEWEGDGGCCDIAESNKLRGMPNWAKAKLAHKRFVAHCLSSSMTIIFCLRARDKVKIMKVNGKEEVIPVGIQPIAEKNFVFEMLLSLQCDEATHQASPIKVPKMLVEMFSTPRLITKADGEHIRKWNESGLAADPAEQLRKRSRVAAEDGMAAYQAFFAALSPAEKKIVQVIHVENKVAAEKADKVPSFGTPEKPADWPDGFDGPDLIFNGTRMRFDEGSGNYQKVVVEERGEAA